MPHSPGDPGRAAPGADVLVLGWGASTRRQLEPFLELWRGLGARPTAFVPDTLRSLAMPQHFRDQARELAGRRWDVVHALSDNGFIAWSLILDELARRGGAPPAAGRREGSAPAAVLLDSCPGCPRWQTRTGFAAAFGRGLTPATLRALGRRPVEVHPVVTPVLERVFAGVYRAFPATMALLASAPDRVLDLAPHVPHTVIAGPDDAIVPEPVVDAFVDALRGRGHDVEVVRVTGSNHVAHLRRHPARYRDAARDLLRRAGIDPASSVHDSSPAR